MGRYVEEYRLLTGVVPSEEAPASFQDEVAYLRGMGNTIPPLDDETRQGILEAARRGHDVNTLVAQACIQASMNPGGERA